MTCASERLSAFVDLHRNGRLFMFELRCLQSRALAHFAVMINYDSECVQTWFKPFTIAGSGVEPDVGIGGVDRR